MADAAGEAAEDQQLERLPGGPRCGGPVAGMGHRQGSSQPEHPIGPAATQRFEFGEGGG
ncbi:MULTISPECIES: hypothetical protein [unclassified Synechococcus]|uniref:hypothetical protein n=1 Tax=unclassified Synechococcus TaxID=2626047 RepID=UPI0021A46B4A|nr:MULTISPECIES: hypothetical protein [unclassified Synechococcus]MCT0212011.1 hypothetical protein [Synechococcus sp. CS-1326]MCT0232421.1 hypothetical protein [Synechococcus sp. CS-1327]